MFSYPRSNERHGYWVVNQEMDLAKATELEWGEASLYWRARFKPAGVRFGPSRNYMSLRLEKLEDGLLRYEVIHKETLAAPKGLVCELPPVVEDDPS